LYLTFFCLTLLNLGRVANALEIPTELRKKLLGDIESKSLNSGMEAGGTMDNSLDPMRYLVGGGDKFQISIVGLPSQEYFPVVDPEGNLYDGELGLIPVGKIPLAQAREVIADKVKKNLRKNYDVYIALRQIKTSTVSVTGLLNNPGTLSLPGNMRILDALKAANGGLLPSPEKFNFRRVRVRNGDSTAEFDLLRFLNKQDMDQNPYLYPGDLIALDQIDAKVFVAGEIRDFVYGWIPVKPGETAGDILDLLNFKETADTTSLILQRSAGGQGTGKALTFSEARPIAVFNNDFISIGAKKSEGRADTIRVTGEVKRPGTYPVPPGGGSLESLIEMAGGATDLGSPERIYILRHSKRNAVLQAMNSNPNGNGYPIENFTGTALQTVRPEIASSMSDLEKSGDFTLLLVPPKEESVFLEDGDEIHLPRKENSVYVSGNVRNPGVYPYLAGAGYRKYIDAANGYTNKADRKNIYVLASYKGASQIKDKKDLAAGDILVIPAAVEYKRWSAVFLPIVLSVPGVLSLIITFIAITK